MFIPSASIPTTVATGSQTRMHGTRHLVSSHRDPREAHRLQLTVRERHATPRLRRDSAIRTQDDRPTVVAPSSQCGASRSAGPGACVTRRHCAKRGTVKSIMPAWAPDQLLAISSSRTRRRRRCSSSPRQQQHRRAVETLARPLHPTFLFGDAMRAASISFRGAGHHSSVSSVASRACGDLQMSVGRLLCFSLISGPAWTRCTRPLRASS